MFHEAQAKSYQSVRPNTEKNVIGVLFCISFHDHPSTVSPAENLRQSR